MTRPHHSTVTWLLLLSSATLYSGVEASAQTGTQAAAPAGKPLIRVGAVQTERRTIDYRLKPAQVLDEVDKTLGTLEQIVQKAGEAGCDVLAFPEDTLGLLNWAGVNEAAAKSVLPEAVKRMLSRLGRHAASHRMYLVVCSDSVEADGGTYNTAFLLGRDGAEIGRYHKVCPTWSECGGRKRGTSLPVFHTPDLGTVGLLICHDLKFPETARCLALQGADILFFPTMAGAAYGDGDIGLQALRVRAAENFVWIVVAQRGRGSMIISPQGKVLAEGQGPDGIAIADIDPASEREGGDAMNWQRDLRARIFRERNPAAFGILTDANPPVLAKVPIDLTSEQAGRIMARVLTVGEDEFGQAAALAAAGKTGEATAAFERLRTEYPGSWIDRLSAQRLAQLRPGSRGSAKPEQASRSPEGPGLAAKHPGDAGIDRDPAVVFAENFESGTIDAIGKRWGDISNKDGKVLAFADDVPTGSGGRRSLAMTGTLGEDSGGHLYTVFKPGLDKAYLRFYTKFATDHAYEHHFVELGGYNPATPWPNPRAGTRPAGDERVMVFIDPIGWYGRYTPPGIWGLYTYWPEMKASADGKYWGNVLSPARPVPIPRGRWVCVELMVQLNSAPEKADGELALWIDGQPAMHFARGMRRGPWSGMGLTLVESGGEPFEGLRLRTSMDLKINHLWLEHYIDEGAQRQNRLEQPTRVNRVWFDDIVVSKEYVGPIKKRDSNER